MQKKILLLLSILLIVSGCSRNPVTGESSFNFYSEQQEIAMGEEYHPQLIAQYGEYADPALKSYIQKLVTKLGAASHRPELDYKVTVLDTPMVNAFAIPGGRVYVCRGILPYFSSEDELAAVMGHEIGHVTARHSVEAMSRDQGLNLGLLLGASLFGGGNKQKTTDIYTAGTAVSKVAGLSYSRENEMQADRLAVEYTFKAGLCPLGMERVSAFFERLEGSGQKNPLNTILSTHPTSDLRRKQARIEVRKLKELYPIKETLERNNYYAAIDHVVLGYNPAKGAVIDNVFYNTTLLLAVNLPEQTANLEAPCFLFSAKLGNATAYLRWYDATVRETTAVNALAQQLQTNYSQTLRFTWQNNSGNGYVYFVKDNNTTYGIYQGLISYRGGLLELITIQPQQAAGSDPTALSLFIKSTRTLSTAEAAAIKPERLTIYTVQTGDTWASITQRYFGTADPKLLAWYNGCELTEPIPEKIKLGLFK